jgi:hypothetical protein
MSEGRPGGFAPCTPTKDKSLEPFNLVGGAGGGLRVLSDVGGAHLLLPRPMNRGLGTSPQRGPGAEPLAFFTP